MGFESSGSEKSVQNAAENVDDEQLQQQQQQQQQQQPQQSKKTGNENDTKRKIETGCENVSNTTAADSKTTDDVKVSLKRHFSVLEDGDSVLECGSRDNEGGEDESDEGKKRLKYDEDGTKGASSKRLKSSEHESGAKDVVDKEEESDDIKTDLKVPPLKIVLPSQSAADSDTISGNRSIRNGNSKNPSNLPYVIRAVASDSMSESEDMPTSTSGLVVGAGTATAAGNAAAATSAAIASDKTDDKKDKESEDQRAANQRVLRSSHKLVQSNTTTASDGAVTDGSGDPNQLSVTSATLTSTSGSSSATTSFSSTLPITSVTSTLTTATSATLSSTASTSASSVLSQVTVTITVSAMTSTSPTIATSTMSSCSASSSTTIATSITTSLSSVTTVTTTTTDTPLSDTTATATAVTSSETESDHSAYNEHESSSTSSVQLNNSVSNAMSAAEMHPRKRKLKQAKEQLASASVSTPASSQSSSSSSASSTSSSSSSSSTNQYQDNANSDQPTNYSSHPHEQPISNCYQLFMDIRKQIEKKRKGLFPVQPKPPQSFNDYLMNRCNYILHGSPNAEMPHMDAPDFIPVVMRDFYIEQEKERHKLRMQHLSEKEKLVLSVEQEILRVHGRAARALANQSLPYSVCTILRDEEVYNFITPEQEEKDRHARSRYTGRLFLSWLQDVDDKWEKIKENMLIRHRNEAEALHAIQQMDWEWRLNDEFDLYAPPSMEDSHIPKVVVNDNFDLLPT